MSSSSESIYDPSDGVNVECTNVAEMNNTVRSRRVNDRHGVHLGRGCTLPTQQSPSNAQNNIGSIQISENSLLSQNRDVTDSTSNQRRQRTKWTREMNEHVMRCYFLVNHNQDM
ncbi:hypothetical protein M8J76_011465 [Diaphorina citri]|nr:hypothetical protein M8J75_008158 [Diaphorina citri]KAI5729569.1 hypothetical protein M8J76_003989 [Diaphorina citri]KAI5730225.1 hypothetical protein M8J76_011465 [Diaphorina citri]